MCVSVMCAARICVLCPTVYFFMSLFLPAVPCCACSLPHPIKTLFSPFSVFLIQLCLPNHISISFILSVFHSHLHSLSHSHSNDAPGTANNSLSIPCPLGFRALNTLRLAPLLFLHTSTQSKSSWAFLAPTYLPQSQWANTLLSPVGKLTLDSLALTKTISTRS